MVDGGADGDVVGATSTGVAALSATDGLGTTTNSLWVGTEAVCSDPSSRTGGGTAGNGLGASAMTDAKRMNPAMAPASQRNLDVIGFEH